MAGVGAEPDETDVGARRPFVRKTTCALTALVLATCCSMASAGGVTTPVHASDLAARGIAIPGTPVLARHFTDREGEHLLVLTRKAGPSPRAPSSGRIEHIALLAALHTRGADGTWKQSWTIRDANDCPGLDGDADFFAREVRFSDIDRDGRIEVTVPYRMFCGGGIEPATIKLILRQGSLKFAIRGEAQVRVPSGAFGGEYKYDKALLDPRNADFKQHLDGMWKRIYIDDRR